MSSWVEQALNYIEKNIVSRINTDSVKNDPHKLIDSMVEFASKYTTCSGDDCSVDDLLAGLHVYLEGLALMILYSNRSKEEKAKLLKTLAGLVYALGSDFAETTFSFSEELES